MISHSIDDITLPENSRIIEIYAIRIQPSCFEPQAIPSEVSDK
jgi:hypothetical protein